jgi:hypothetical protein
MLPGWFLFGTNYPGGCQKYQNSNYCRSSDLIQSSNLMMTFSTKVGAILVSVSISFFLTAGSAKGQS